MRYCALLLASLASLAFLGTVATHSAEASDQGGTVLATSSEEDTWGWG